MTAYQVGNVEGQWTVGIALVPAVVWVATGRWRDHPRAEGRTAEQVAAVVRFRSRLVKGSMLAVTVLWIVTNIAVDTWVVHR